ncbi:Ribosomal large subunit pseudouridine synthase B [Tepidimonas alkaliphilus]|uniref:Pseudouridine synthase n=1 Tax=Tepidimonas alkaliphilus TaxID=2588942 RepID=A0A554WDC0_9BURK|nr:Ribosomal large subunit pseudouridine synthase B [Tepidimonas alkaliphilus]
MKRSRSAAASAPREPRSAAGLPSAKLHKVLAQLGLGSRADMEAAIAAGRVKVNGQPAHVGQRVTVRDTIHLDGQQVRWRAQRSRLPRVLAYHKPVGEVVTLDDPQNRPTPFARLPALRQGKWMAVGRLDINTEGLLLLTDSGELANRLMHPRFGLEREYAVRVLGALSSDERERLLSGVELDDGPARVQALEELGGTGANRWYRVVLTEGRNREVRRLFEAVGHAVSRLIRVRYGTVTLPRGVRRGTWWELEPQAVADLMAQAGLPLPADQQPRPRAAATSPATGSPRSRASASGVAAAVNKASRPAAPQAPTSARKSGSRLSARRQNG